jgi:hypothetical protein
MTEDQAKRIALDFVSKSNLEPCAFDSIQRFPHSDLTTSVSPGDEWVVRFAFDLPDDVACSTEMAIVLIDDATGEPRLLESL